MWGVVTTCPKTGLGCLCNPYAPDCPESAAPPAPLKEPAPVRVPRLSSELVRTNVHRCPFCNTQCEKQHNGADFFADPDSTVWFCMDDNCGWNEDRGLPK